MTSRVIAVTNYTEAQLSKLDTVSLRELYDATSQLRQVNAKAMEEIRNRELRRKSRIQAAIRQQAEDKQAEADYHRNLREKIASDYFAIPRKSTDLIGRHHEQNPVLDEIGKAKAELRKAERDLRATGGRQAIQRVAQARQRVGVWEAQMQEVGK